MRIVSKIINRICVISRRIINRSVLHIYPSEQGGWIKDNSFCIDSNDIYFDPYSLEGEEHTYLCQIEINAQSNALMSTMT